MKKFRLLIIFLLVLTVSAVFYASYRLGQKTKTDVDRQLVTNSRESTNPDQQIRRIRFIDQQTGEITEILIDGTINYYDKSGKLIKTARRGFAQTQQILKKFEWLINNRQNISGGQYRIEIETQLGTIIVNPGTGGAGQDEISDAVDFIDHTLNPTPTPRPTSIPSAQPTTSPLPSASIEPTPLPDKPDYLNAPPFNCTDYLNAGGKPIKINDIFCGY